MQIAVVGTGYVGLVSGACFALHHLRALVRDGVVIDMRNVLNSVQAPRSGRVHVGIGRVASGVDAR